ncbi:hypothetical protein AB0M43_15230 [Longispora sp. NPDC051575]|uniref:hypothetical protein n=1 Tax=Longispora sp. NPDC051575 TaxID=3154943 RepID=UPI003435CB38
MSDPAEGTPQPAAAPESGFGRAVGLATVPRPAGYQDPVLAAVPAQRSAVTPAPARTPAPAPPASKFRVFGEVVLRRAIGGLIVLAVIAVVTYTWNYFHR